MKRKFDIIQPGEVTMYLYEDGFTGDDKKDLEIIFDRFNCGSGNESPNFRSMRSLSTNDFVKLDTRIYQCKSVGWKRVLPSFVAEIDRRVREHPDFNESAWIALDRVMWQLRKPVTACHTNGLETVNSNQ
jgi:hypothetical protein